MKDRDRVDEKEIMAAGAGACQVRRVMAGMSRMRTIAAHGENCMRRPGTLFATLRLAMFGLFRRRPRDRR
jgi:hypothetical protein